jgi:uncharacterized membrane protein (UPF0127 family)
LIGRLPDAKHLAMSLSRRAMLALTVGVACAALSTRESAAQAVIFDTAQLTLVTHSGRYDFVVKVADSPVKSQLGLRYQNNVPPDGGMLFPANLGSPGVLKIATLGLMLTTDILFVSDDGRIVELHPWVKPNSADVVSMMPVAAALQLAGGTISRLGITFGDRVLSSMFHQTI